VSQVNGSRFLAVQPSTPLRSSHMLQQLIHFTPSRRRTPVLVSLLVGSYLTKLLLLSRLRPLQKIRVVRSCKRIADKKLGSKILGERDSRCLPFCRQSRKASEKPAAEHRRPCGSPRGRCRPSWPAALARRRSAHEACHTEITQTAIFTSVFRSFGFERQRLCPPTRTFPSFRAR